MGTLQYIAAPQGIVGSGGVVWCGVVWCSVLRYGALSCPALPCLAPHRRTAPMHTCKYTRSGMVLIISSKESNPNSFRRVFICFVVPAFSCNVKRQTSDP